MKKNKYSKKLSFSFILLLVLVVVLGFVFLYSTDYYDGNTEKARLMKKINKKYFSIDDYDGSSERDYAIHKLIRLACELHHQNKPIDVQISIQDRGSDEKGVYTFCYPDDSPDLAPYCGPDWCCYWWKTANINNYLVTARLLETMGKQKPTTKKAGWVGNIYSPLADVPESKTRPLLKKIAEKNPSILEAIHVSPVNGQIVQVPNYMTLDDQVRRYKYLIDIGGNGYSGRLKMLLWTGRPILLVKRRYIEYFYKDMVPFQHYIPVKEDLSDLVQQIQWCRSHPKEASQIGENALLFAKKTFSLEQMLESVYLTLVACRDYHKNNISSYKNEGTTSSKKSN